MEEATKRKPGRPATPIADRRLVQMLIRTNPAERRELDAGASRDGMSLTAWMLRLGLKAARRKR